MRGRKHALTNKRIKEVRSLLRYMKAKNIDFSFNYIAHRLKIKNVDVQLELIDVLEEKGYLSKEIPHFGRIILL